MAHKMRRLSRNITQIIYPRRDGSASQHPWPPPIAPKGCCCSRLYTKGVAFYVCNTSGEIVVLDLVADPSTSL